MRWTFGEIGRSAQLDCFSAGECDGIFRELVLSRLRISHARFDGRELVAIFCGGVVGAMARTGLEALAGAGAGEWPWTTFAVNVAGAALLGYFVTRLQERLPLSAYRRPLLGTGLCGALTTFSTMQLELLEMIDAGRYGLAVAYTCASVSAGLAAVFLTSGLTRRARVLT
jgi:CrcB protein